MKKICIILIISLMVSVIYSFPVMANGIGVVLDGEEISFDVPPQLINDRVMVPMRKIFESLNASVEWEGDTQTITAENGEKKVIMQIDNPVITVNGTKILLDVPPQLVDERTLVPVRAVAESFNAEVNWVDSTSTVEIWTIKDNLSENIIVDLSKETEFRCLTNSYITYGFDDIWYRTISTGFSPLLASAGKIYRGQTLFISPLYANITTDKNGKGKVNVSVTGIKPNGERTVFIKDVTVIDGSITPGQIIKSSINLEYSTDTSDPLGEYTFIVESKDVVGNKSVVNEIKVNIEEYKYTPKAFESVDELINFVCNYGRNPNPDRIIDAIVFIEKNGMMTYPMLFTSCIEMIAKNPYLIERAIQAFEKEFGEGGTPTLKILDETAAIYIDVLKQNDPATMTYVQVPEASKDMMNIGACLGIYCASGSYDAAKAYAESLKYGEFSDRDVVEYMVPNVRDFISADPLFRAYCTYMVQFDEDFDKNAKEKLKALL